ATQRGELHALHVVERELADRRDGLVVQEACDEGLQARVARFIQRGGEGNARAGAQPRVGIEGCWAQEAPEPRSQDGACLAEHARQEAVPARRLDTRAAIAVATADGRR